MRTTSDSLIKIYDLLWRAYPDDVHIARPLVGMLRDEGNVAEAQQVALQMARNLLSRGAASQAKNFLQICQQLDHPEKDELLSLSTVASLTEEADALPDLNRTFALINQLSDEEAKEFILQGKLRTFLAGDDVIRQGDVGDTFYLILEGLLDVSIHTADHRDIVVKRLDSGDFFGEFACVYQLARTATVTPRVPSTLLEFTEQDIMNLAKNSTFAAERLMAIIRQRLVESMAMTHPGFEKVIGDDRSWVGQRSRVLVLKPGAFEKKEVLESHCCIVLHGKLLTQREETDGTRYSLELQQNDMFGNITKYVSVPEDVEFVVEERCIICCVPRQVFRSLMMAYPDFEEWVKSHGSKHRKAWHIELPEES